jgi:hypothetical protein
MNNQIIDVPDNPVVPSTPSHILAQAQQKYPRIRHEDYAWDSNGTCIGHLDAKGRMRWAQEFSPHRGEGKNVPHLDGADNSYGLVSVCTYKECDDWRDSLPPTQDYVSVQELSMHIRGHSLDPNLISVFKDWIVETLSDNKDGYISYLEKKVAI